jgi:hypothetical protein
MRIVCLIPHNLIYPEEWWGREGLWLLKKSPIAGVSAIAAPDPTLRCQGLRPDRSSLSDG